MRSKHEKLLRSLNNDLKLYKIVEDLSYDITSDRIMLIYIHNGGGCIVPGKTKFMSVVLEKVKNLEINSRKDDFQRVVMGDNYLTYIIEMIYSNSYSVIVNTKNLCPSKMRDIYDIDGIQKSVMSYIASNPDNIWYLCINYKNDDVILDKETLSKIDVARNKICNILDNYFTLTHRAKL
jgi:hypothetical protein